MPISQYQKEKIEELERKAYGLHKSGFTYREIGDMLDKSHGWVGNAVKKQKDLEEKESKEVDKI